MMVLCTLIAHLILYSIAAILRRASGMSSRTWEGKPSMSRASHFTILMAIALHTQYPTVAVRY